MLPSILAKQLEKGIGDYIETTFPMINEPFKGSIEKMVGTKDAVYHEPYVAVHLPFRIGEKVDRFESIKPKYAPYVHQALAFERLTGEDGRSTLIATGTGSGKTECFLYPILEYCYKHRGEPGIKALIIYPMNALATDQAKRIAKLINDSTELKGNVTAGMYVGGREGTPSRMMSKDGIITDHDTMLNQSPDILLTNYKMLDYLLVRPKDANMWRDNDPETLKYIAVDELHTFDGAQGTDLGCLLRRLKSRLYTPRGYLCCVGTSATMGSKNSTENIRQYAKEVFDETFENDSVITEDRLTANEFFDESEITEFKMPTENQLEELEILVESENEYKYLEKSVECWFDSFKYDLKSDVGRLELAKKLMHHSFLQSTVSLMAGNYWQVSHIVEELKVQYPELRILKNGDALVNSLLALVSHARNGSEGKIRPFLNVHVQLLMRELRRIVAKVAQDNVVYSIAHDLNAQQAKQYLPVVNCRDCGATGWVSMDNGKHSVSMDNLDTFYNLYFKCDDKITMMFPWPSDEIPKNIGKNKLYQGKLCPDCLEVQLGDTNSGNCSSCGQKMISVAIPTPIPVSGKQNHKQYSCPFCGSKHGISLMGLRSTTEISASLSQLFASKFNDDKKLLAFSDNVQDAAHRAGFFNSRTWRFGLRGAIQKFIADGGDGESLQEFSKDFISYWHLKMTDEEFVSFFIPPNMTWFKAYEEMKEKRKLGNSKSALNLVANIEARLNYEIMLEYGLTSRIGRTLEKSGCSSLAFNIDEIHDVANKVQERTVNELGILKDCKLIEFEQMVLGFLDIMRMNGAYNDPTFFQFLNENGKEYLLSNKIKNWMPGVNARNIPRFIYEPKINKKVASFDEIYGRKYLEWIEDCCSQVLEALSSLVEEDYSRLLAKLIFEELKKSEIVGLVVQTIEYNAYGIDKKRLYVSSRVKQIRCSTCGALHTVAEEDAEIWESAPCLRSSCTGKMYIDDTASLGYYGELYTSGDLARINAREHTGLLGRDDREKLETDFKRDKDSWQRWDPNVLSCTPTLEMGIDIGDMSTVILCSMPPTPAQFLQRVGRAGRKDGNSLTLAIANSKPHDLYFYADPRDMIEGEVNPPKIFLKASAVLERQFVAYCMDSWVKKGVREDAIPKHISVCLRNLDEHNADVFPFNFLNYVKTHLSSLHNSFISLFTDTWGKDSEIIKEELNSFAKSDKLNDKSMEMRIFDSFRDLKNQENSLKETIENLKKLIKELKDKPKDQSFDGDIKEFKAELVAHLNVRRSLKNKNVFNFLSDEGLLPNYAFPEAGIILRAVLYRREDEEKEGSRRKYEKMVYEYNRSASSAISEFAPNNNFYVDGKKITIDRIDLTTAQAEKWRLCPNCSHAQIEVAGKDVTSCPRCGSTEWSDIGQVRTMLKVQMVYSNMEYKKSLIGDESDNRSNVFYCKQLMVDVDEENDITSAYRMDNDDFAFGYEFVRKATLREVNFGEKDLTGEKLSVAGIEDVRKGFKICKYCGKIQGENGKEAQHTPSCKFWNKKNTSEDNKDDSYEECLFLYRQFETEILRILIPATTMDATEFRTESFTAAFMLGMKEYFGNVEHLRATVSEVPIADSEYRKQYLIIYDSVPGGTGYLKQLLREKDALLQIFEKSLAVLENCSCKEDPQKDGCYHCLFAYRQSRNIGSISRSAAIKMLKSIIGGKDRIEKINKLADIPINSLFDSELERRFIEAIAQMGNSNREVNITRALVHEKEGYVLTITTATDKFTWEIEPQVLLGPANGVVVQCKPDFIIWPISKNIEQMPVAIFTDGFMYHKNKIEDDTLKREAIIKSGKYRVWSLSWNDVKNAIEKVDAYATETLEFSKMPFGDTIYLKTINGKLGETIKPSEISTLELLMGYLSLNKAEEIFAIQAKAYSLSLLDPISKANKEKFNKWKEKFDEIIDATNFTNEDYVEGETFFGNWIPSDGNSHFSTYSGIFSKDLTEQYNNPPISVCAILDDREDIRTDKYEKDWNGFWHFVNLMQFASNFIAVSEIGIGDGTYLSLPIDGLETDASNGSKIVSYNAWEEFEKMLIDELYYEPEELMCLEKIRTCTEKVPDEVGYEVTNQFGAVIAIVEFAWIKDKIGYLTQEQLEDKEILEELGWTIISDETEIDNRIFGGDN